MDGLTEGRIVHFVMQTDTYQGVVHRPAIVVRVWDKATGYVNLQVFTDNTNDGVSENVQWVTSVLYSEEPIARTWHWIEKA